MKTTMDHAGRVMIPKPVRDSAGLKPGASVNVECRDGRVQIEPVFKPVKWVRNGSFIVAKAPAGTPPVAATTTRKLIAEIRDERGRDLCR